LGQIVSKANRQIRVVDANSFSVDGVSATVDVIAEGLTVVRNGPRGLRPFI
jgi:hypothetical protein